LLRIIISADGPVAAVDIARRMGLTPRQVRYRLKPAEIWLAERDVAIKSVPGAGILLDCSSRRRFDLMRQLDAEFEFDLVLSPGQRRQLFTFRLLTADEPLTLRQLQNAAQVAHTTVFNDLASIEEWLASLSLTLARRRNYGLLVEGSELARRQALAALSWGDAPFGESLTEMTYDRGLVFSMSDYGALLPIIQSVANQVSAWDTRWALKWVAAAEAELEGRFTDDVVLHLALAFAIQVERVTNGRLTACQAEELDWLRERYVWNVAVDLSKRMQSDVEEDWPADEIAAIAMHLLAGSRSELWPRDFDQNGLLNDLVDSLIDEAAEAFRTPELRRDVSLRDGLWAHLVPAIMRQRFGLWAPSPLSESDLPPAFRREYAIARELAREVSERTGFALPVGEVHNLALLLRAAFIRERPDHPRRVFVVCPGGMATAQLVVARLRARFPHLEIIGVLSIREITRERVADAQLIISTAPVEAPAPWIDVIQVHPLLTDADVEAVTHWLT
jgi:mannitol operon transcriptional antiterminator